MNAGLDRIARGISSEIESELERIGLLFRIFDRAKSEESLKRKLERKKYHLDSNGKLMQDLIGIRVVLYFKDDIPLVYKALKSKFEFVDETIDEAEETVFAPNRINLIFRLKKDYQEEVTDTIIRDYRYIDTTYEVQIRTMLSEGWHEIEHDLRYKCSEDWEDFQELSRTLNGLYAALETNDWSILSLFDKLAYEHYKAKNLPAMLRNKFRVRVSNEPIEPALMKVINNSDDNLIKQILRVDRNEFLNQIFDDGVKFPITLSNLVYVINGYYIKDRALLNITPSYITDKKAIFR
ncbi:hypothetical protein [Ekhidna sp.]|uniref:hypothetical protein n=1 Tax=Ekhidna sp. TaxID=2608089 RepID=UPI003B5C6BC6